MEEHSERTYKLFNNRIHKLGRKLKTVSFIGFEGVPIYDVTWFFFRGLQKGSLNTRATSVAFNFLLAMGPAIIFLLMMIPYIPISNFQNILLEVLYDIIPENSYIAIETLVTELFEKRSGLQVFGLLVALFFAQKGVNGMIEAFNATYHSIETRPWHKQRMVAILLVFILLFLATFAIVLMFFSQFILNNLVEFGILKMNITYYLLMTGKWIIIIGITFLSISFLYYLTPLRKTQWKFMSAGSTLATILTIVASVGFSYFVNHFAQFNRFFGSIGALIALMLWMNFNALTLLIGFELNASIKNARLSISEP
ncbi:MAG: YihY/virulence factor BrkB family protein [Bacteroidales bacterium]|nr:YihY/virulence factor BrkB family protein [Bacteroidales bacterium]